ncbi:hypothetical protein MUK42_16662 [Musa troglodytarum]|uniref:Uncharacterized protein n=1 Tax=Musa troglodytarum TaxID=320322 RepID=A0A9E7FVY1_9LILI|nr:hypothetical protein MUK42_16662 [Musa troglodytarum]
MVSRSDSHENEADDRTKLAQQTWGAKTSTKYHMTPPQSSQLIEVQPSLLPRRNPLFLPRQLLSLTSFSRSRSTFGEKEECKHQSLPFLGREQEEDRRPALATDRSVPSRVGRSTKTPTPATDMHGPVTALAEQR